MAKGFQLTPIIDIYDTFSLVIKPITLRIIFTLDVSHNLPIHQVDVNYSFLNEVLRGGGIYDST